MKRAIAGILMLIGIGVAPAFAWDGDHGLRRDIRHDRAKIATTATNCAVISAMAITQRHDMSSAKSGTKSVI